MLKANPLYVDISTAFAFAHCSLYSDDDENMIWLVIKHGRRRWSTTASRVLAHPAHLHTIVDF